jgi:hypothetical protein
MSIPAVREDPQAISTSLKEAVVDSLLNLVHGRISGVGEFGAVIYGTRPRNIFASAFLMPMEDVKEGDEVTSPIRIASHGLDIQVLKEHGLSITIQPYFSLYVRVLPNEVDLKREDCRFTIRLKKDVAKELQSAKREALNKKWEEVKGSYKSRKEHPEWLKIRDEVYASLHTARGIPPDLAHLGGSEETDVEAAASVSDGVPAEGAADGTGEAPATSMGVVVTGGKLLAIALKDELCEPLRIPHKWLRLELELPPLEYPLFASAPERQAAEEAHHAAMDEAIIRRLASWMESEDSNMGGKLWAFRKDETILPSQAKDWNKYLAELRLRGNPPILPIIVPRWNIVVAPDWLNPKRLNVHIALENKSKDPRKNFEYADHSMFQISLRVALPKTVHHPLKLERVEPSYRYNKYLTYPASGFNGGVVELAGAEGQVLLETTWAPRFIQPRIMPTSYLDIECNVRALADPASFDCLKPLSTRFREWLIKMPEDIDVAEGLDSSDKESIERERQQFATDMQAWSEEARAIETGLSILEESRKHWVARGSQSNEAAIPFEAWLAMNEAMADLMEEKFPKPQWRMFQLAFILANLSAMATRLRHFKDHYVANRDDAVTLLYFPTGGGKSEAFFGLLVFSLFLDRLRQKQIGVTAMIRYPLRLLTIQQAQRASRVLAKAELVRRKQGYGGQPFSIGFWVGSGGSPNRLNSEGVADIPTTGEAAADLETEEKLLENSGKYKAAVRAWNKIPRCPFCRSQTVLRRFPNEGGTIGHVCSDAKCKANDGKYRPLPFYICDEDIYDFAPSVVLGTVDKLALIGHYPTTIRRIMGMLGAAPWRRLDNLRLVVPSPQDLREGPNKKGCEGLWPAYPEGNQVFSDPFPSLLIQDEAHLLDESLGTFAGLFESTLDAVFAELFKSLKDISARSPDGKRRRAKVIAASATVSEPERQLEHLYQRKTPAIQFPYPGPDLYSSFYASPAPCDAEEAARSNHANIEVRSKQARVYAGFMTNGRPHTATSVAVLSNFHLIISELFEAVVSGEDARIVVARELMSRHISEGPLAAIHRPLLMSSSAGQLATLIDLHRISLTYVTNKKGGDQIMSAESEETRKRHADAGLPFEQLLTRLITGSIDQGEIQNVIDTAQSRPKPGEPFLPLLGALRSVIATSAVSHGVDVEEFNTMFFAGLPSDVAEYIQASSRIGRTHVGFCVLIPTPQRRRDRFVIEVFDVYHRFLERMVQPAAIDRWAERAVERVLPSLFQAFVCGVTPSNDIIKAHPADKGDVKPNSSIPEILSWYNAGQKAFLEGVIGFIERALGLDTNFAPPGESLPHYKEVAERRIRDILNRIGERDWAGSPLPTFFKGQTNPLWRPMTSLRDVDEGGVIRLAFKDFNGSSQDAAVVKSIMGFIRNGVAESGDDPMEEV